MLVRRAKLATRWRFVIGWAIAFFCAEASGQTASPTADIQSEVWSAGAEQNAFEPLAAASFDSCVGQPLPSTVGQRAWQKGGFRIVPYGAFWADMIYATERTEPGAFTLFVLSPEQDGEDAFVIDARRTRLGADVSGPKIGALGNAESGGRVEIDFHGNFVTENRANVLLRQAYWEVKNKRFRLLVGQTSDVISPLIPGTLNYSVGWAGGNIGFRRTQFRGERYLAASDRFLLTLQGGAQPRHRG